MWEDVLACGTPGSAHEQPLQEEPQGRDPLRCVLCGEIFGSEEQANRYEKIHQGDGQPCCPQCKKTCSDLGHLKLHNFTFAATERRDLTAVHKHGSRLQTRRSRKRVWCSQCGKSLYWGALQGWFTQGKGCTRPPLWEKFQQLSRPERSPKDSYWVKPFPCTQHGKHFNLHGILKDHQRIHTGERPSPCTE